MEAILTRRSFAGSSVFGDAPERLSRGVSWDFFQRTAVGGLTALLLAAALAPLGSQADPNPPMTSVIVRESADAGSRPERAVRHAGGYIQQRLHVIDGFSAMVPFRAIADVAGTDGVASITANGHVQLLDDDYRCERYDLNASPADRADEDEDCDEDAYQGNSMYHVTKMSGARQFWARGYTGRGVDIALIDSGISPVEGLKTPGKVINGADLSFESQAPELRYLDTYGHGTHLAGIMAGKGPGARDGHLVRDKTTFLGMAPDARLLSVKVATADGSTDVAQVIAAIGWVVEHRHDNGMDVRVLNLSFGTDGTQSYVLDPLAFAVEQAWHSGIAVVAAVGNRGPGAGLSNPARDPFVIAVGASEPKGTYRSQDDIAAPFSSTAVGYDRGPDLLAPGKRIVSLRVPNSYLDMAYPEGRYGSKGFRGSGTSQAAAVVSGAAALIIDQRPNITPDQLKRLLVTTASKLRRGGNEQAQGSGRLDLDDALRRQTPNHNQSFPESTGLGSLDDARGSLRVSIDGVALRGEVDIFGSPFSVLGGSLGWVGGLWNGNSWSGNSWSGNSWSGSAWATVAWSGNSWSGNSWSGNIWSGNSWSGNSWSGNSWSGNSWSGNSWSCDAWSSLAWY